MTVKLLTEQHLKFLNLKGGCTGLSESILVKMPHCWQSHVAVWLFSMIRVLILDLFSFNGFLTISEAVLHILTTFH